MRTKFTPAALFFFALLQLLNIQHALGQTLRPGSFSYATPKAFTKGAQISPLTPIPGDGVSTIAPGAHLGQPAGLAVDAAGNLYVAGKYNDGIKKISAADGTITILGSGFANPFGVAVDSAGNVYVADTFNDAVKKISASDNSVSILGTGFLKPTGVTVDAAGNVYVADYYHSAVKKISAADGSITTVGSGYTRPTNVAVDAAGNVYVCNNAGGDIRKVTPDGTETTIGEGFASPWGVSVDAVGNVYVGDFGNNAVKEILVADGSTITLATGFSIPNGVAVDATGNVYVADFGNFAVKKITAHGKADSYTVSPALPDGLQIDAITGVISGTPTVQSAQTNYTVTATNTAGSVNTVLQIKVNNTAPPFAYPGSPYTFTIGQPIEPIARKVTDGLLNTYSVSPALPAGLSIDAVTGVMSGTPTVLTAHSNYKITVTNTLGSKSTNIKIAVINYMCATTSTTKVILCDNSALPYLWNGKLYKSAGRHSIHLTNANGCDSAATLVLVITDLSATYKASQPTLCYNGASDSKVSASGGLQPYQFSIDGGATYQPTGHFNLDAAGNYNVTVKDSAGCMAVTNTVTIQKPGTPLSASLVKTTITCKNADDGAITVTAQGGYSDYKYSINSGAYQTGNFFNNLAAGTDTLHIKDANGCATKLTIKLVQPNTICSSLSSVTTGASAAKALIPLTVKVAPNPAVTNFVLTVQGGDDKKVMELRVTDMLGRTIYHTAGPVSGSYTFGQNFAGGMYIAEVVNGNNAARVKLIKGR